MNQLLVICVLTLSVCPLRSQLIRPISIPGIFSMIRFQNTVCNGDNEEGGTCLYENECLSRKGQVIGRCANGFAACCSFKFTCNGETSQNETLFVNKQYPDFENETNTCQVTIKKLPNVCQLRLGETCSSLFSLFTVLFVDFEEFQLSQPDENGFCTTDSFMVRTTVGERLPIICGENGGQHIYVDMGRGSANPVVLSIVTNGNRSNRKWKLKINMIPCNNLDMAPSGCLQYYRSPTDVIKSFNFGPKIEFRARYLANLRYTVCIRTEENFCAIKWETAEPGSFLFGAPFEGLPISPIIVCKLFVCFVGKDTEFGECSHPFPFVPLNSGKSGKKLSSESVLPGVMPAERDPLFPSRICNGGASGQLCNFDDFVGIDQGSLEGTGQGEDRFCGAKLLDHDFVICKH
ncbi:uncharacterized protein LOC128958550 [Oppia nitens]|uniref:uncharacterized protein LOC128958550 n=1 Tax=Oppia nitens TaxID=1686743 RepID=UPI0023DA8EAD|nr:uncharacterized protein LOC128958550 [Oppia nitens]